MNRILGMGFWNGILGWDSKTNYWDVCSSKTLNGDSGIEYWNVVLEQGTVVRF